MGTGVAGAVAGSSVRAESASEVGVGEGIDASSSKKKGVGGTGDGVG